MGPAITLSRREKGHPLLVLMMEVTTHSFEKRTLAIHLIPSTERGSHPSFKEGSGYPPFFRGHWQATSSLPSKKRPTSTERGSHPYFEEGGGHPFLSKRGSGTLLFAGARWPPGSCKYIILQYIIVCHIRLHYIILFYIIYKYTCT